MGRKATLVIGGFIFLVDTAINTAAANVAMLIIGHLMLGFGIGFTNQAAPGYLTEMAQPEWRGAFNSGFKLFVGLGVVSETIINFVASHLGDWGWRVALGLGALPPTFMTLGVLCIPDTPNSLVERGYLSEARKSLAQVCGVDSNVELELLDI
ncbi:hypothetical protein GIB67_013920 [Kingdonia uniflora]|uniref:Major facilitator superfamily (MFS) profile domain-containing protein n=1 Tax=Kingdonia uniflora TaxID=39325 RepID=A0A7J7LDC6_9MAGN|nr:hypothetical protein GIB67_013920 [Kingdonia uniflora]